MAVDTFHNSFYINATMTAGAVTTPLSQGSFILDGRVESYTNFNVRINTTNTTAYQVQLEGSLDNVTYDLIGSPLTADGAYSLTNSQLWYPFIRAHIVSVTPVASTTPTITWWYVATS